MTKNTKRGELIGDICLYGNSQIGFGWIACHAVDGRAVTHGDHTPRAGRSATEAVWQAVDALRAAGVNWRGVVAIYAPGGERVAIAPVASVPWYGSLRWQPAGPGIVISAEQIQAAADSLA